MKTKWRSRLWARKCWCKIIYPKKHLNMHSIKARKSSWKFLRGNVADVWSQNNHPGTQRRHLQKKKSLKDSEHSFHLQLMKYKLCNCNKTFLGYNCTLFSISSVPVYHKNTTAKNSIALHLHTVYDTPMEPRFTEQTHFLANIKLFNRFLATKYRFQFVSVLNYF